MRLTCDVKTYPTPPPPLANYSPNPRRKRGYSNDCVCTYVAPSAINRRGATQITGISNSWTTLNPTRRSFLRGCASFYGFFFLKPRAGSFEETNFQRESLERDLQANPFNGEIITVIAASPFASVISLDHEKPLSIHFLLEENKFKPRNYEDLSFRETTRINKVSSLNLRWNR